jgi:hypothetical protein
LSKRRENSVFGRAGRSPIGEAMAGYLDQYGVGDERREKIFKTLAIAVVVLVVIGGPLLFIFHDYRQESQVKQFFKLLEAHQYKEAYALWGCTDAKPCQGYDMGRFMEDWGPGKADVSNFRIERSRSCGSGVILTVDFDKNRQEKLWVQRDDLTIGFSPLAGCPAPK